MKSRITLLVAFALAFFISTTSFSQVVTSGADDGSDGTLRKEIADTPPGGTVSFDGVSTVTLNSELLIDKNLTITGIVGPAITIDADSNGRIFNITSGTVILNDLILTNGLEENGGAIYITNANLTINSSILTENVASGTGSPAGSGGAIFNDVGGNLTVNNSVISANLANRAGGGIEDNSGAGLSISLNNVNFENNDAGVASGNALPGNGGALHISGAGDITITGGTVSGNIAAKEGGGLWNGSGIMEVNGVSITGNSAIGNATGGGGIFNNGGTLTVDAATTLTENIADGADVGGRGGAIFNNTGGSLNLANGLNITGNYASRAGGAIEDNSNGTLTLSGVVLQDNAAGVDIGLGNTITPNPGNGGAVHLSGTTSAIVDGFTDISNNLAASEGGGLWNNTGTMNVSLTIMDGNVASGDAAENGGGAIYNNGGTLIVGNAATISNNVADGAAGSGGAILSTDGAVTVIGAVMAFNRANRAGGAIEIIDGSIDISGNFNISENNAGVGPDAVAAPGNGGGLHITGDADATITGGEMSENLAASEGGALWNSTGTMTVDGTIINANDAQGADADNGGGGIFNNRGALIVTPATTITNNTASGALGSGGGIFSLTPGTLSIDGLTIEDNIANRAGGGIEINSAAGETYTFTDVTLDGNTVNGPAPGNGGGLHITGMGNVEYNGGSVVNNIAYEGGGLWNSVGIMTISGTTITGNIANGNATGGGGLFNNGGTLIVDAATTLTQNLADGIDVGGRGGAIFNNVGGTLNLATGMTISDNYASRAGGAIEDNSGNTLTLDSVTLTGNSAGVDIGLGNTITPNPGNGGAVHLSGTTSAIILNSTVTSNLAALEGGGLWNSTGTMTVDNTLVDSNDAQGAAADGGGGGIYNNGGTLIVQNATLVTNNIASGAAGSGGGILSTDGAVTIQGNDTKINSNQANRAGGGIEIIDGSLTTTGIDLNNNNAGVSPAVAAPGNGGGLHVSGTATIEINGGNVNDNIAASEGGGVWNQAGSTMTLSALNMNFNVASGNDADHGGGAIYNNGGTLMVSGAIIGQNIADGVSGSGGAALSTGGEFSISGSSIFGNVANRAGGGIELTGGTLTLINIQLSSNNAGVAPAIANPGNGGGLHITGDATTNILGGSSNNNIAANEGGGLWNGSGLMMLLDHTVNANTASGNDTDTPGGAGGGGIYNEGGTLDLSGSTAITNNVADGAQSTGGGILNASGTLTANGITIMDNTSNRAGGGIETNGSGAVNLTNVSLDSNDTGVVTGMGAPGNGGGLHVSGDSAVTINGGTTNSNTAANEGGGLWNGSGLMTVIDHIVDANTASGNDTDTPGGAGGGGIFNEGGTLDLSGSTAITNNVADGAQSTGGGILNASGTLNANGISIMDNTSNRAGGGIETNGDSSVELTDVSLDNNFTGAVTGAGAPGNGGGLHVSGAAPVTITGGTVNGNVAAKEGGGLWNNQGLLTITGTTISGNDAQGDFVADPVEIVGGGGIFAEDGAGSVIINEGTTISGNFATGAQGSGGGILMATGTTLTINGTESSPVIISDNAASRAGGGIEDWSLSTNSNSLSFVNFTGNTVGLDNGSFTANGGPGNGGAIHVTGPGINTITNGSATLNVAASEGGGFWNNLGTMTVDGTSFTDNDAQGDDASNGGGALFNNGGTLIVQNGVVIFENTATGASGSGGGIQGVDGGTVSVTDSEISGNTSNRAGGGIEMAAGDLILSNSDVSSNNAGTAPGNGGGVHLGGAATANISTSTFRNNIAVEGGALWNSGTNMTVMTSEVSGNSANEGGGVYNETGGTTSVMTSTISANSASVSGGGITNNGTSLDINAATVATNTTVGNGGGIDAITNVSIKNTIVALNTAASGTDVSGLLTSNNYNLIGTDDLDVFTAQANDLEEADPVVGPLQNNGGTTFTHQLLDGSPHLMLEIQQISLLIKLVRLYLVRHVILVLTNLK